MMNCFLFSLFLHLAILTAMGYSRNVNTSGAAKIEVNIVEKSKKERNSVFLPTVSKPLKSRGPGVGGQKTPQIDLKDYADHLKMTVDPIWYNKLKRSGLNNSSFLATEVLIFPDKYGMIISVKVVKSSGSQVFDKLAIEALREVKQIPKPPDILVREGLIWEFSVGKE